MFGPTVRRGVPGVFAGSVVGAGDEDDCFCSALIRAAVEFAALAVSVLTATAASGTASGCGA